MTIPIGKTGIRVLHDLAPALEAFLAEPRNVIVAGIRKDGRPTSPQLVLLGRRALLRLDHPPPGEVKIFSPDPREELVVDDATGHRYVAISGTVESSRTQAQPSPLPRHPREARPPGSARRHLAHALIADDRVLLAITPNTPDPTGPASPRLSRALNPSGRAHRSSYESMVPRRGCAIGGPGQARRWHIHPLSRQVPFGVAGVADSVGTWRDPRPGGRASTLRPHRHHAQQAGRQPRGSGWGGWRSRRLGSA